MNIILVVPHFINGVQHADGMDVLMMKRLEDHWGEIMIKKFSLESSSYLMIMSA